MMKFVDYLNTRALLPCMLICLFLSGIYIAVRTKFFIIAKPKHVFSSVINSDSDNRKSSFRSLTVALAGTLGVGNIVGVADAIRFGGAGSVFWMLFSAVVAMFLKYAEVVLAVKYKSDSHGGTFYYIRDALKKPRIASFFAVLCVLCSFTLGNTVQSKAVSDAMETAFKIPPVVTGIFLALGCSLVIFGGFTKISSFTVKLIPSLCALYVVLCLIIIGANIALVPKILSDIFKDAFNFKSCASGVGCFGMFSAMRYGCMRGIISNEAGCGTAPIAHSAAKENNPAKQGCFGVVEVFTDTVILCTLTALVLLIYPQSEESSMNGVIASFGQFYGAVSEYIISLSILFFAFATLICWSFYGTESIIFLNGSKRTRKAYSAIFCIFCIIGAVTGEQISWLLADSTVCIMTVINCIAICLLSDKISKETDSFITSSARRFSHGRKQAYHREARM